MLQFFESARNIGIGRNVDVSDDPISAVADNNYETFTSISTIKSHIDASGNGSGAARSFSHLFIKMSNVASIAVTSAGDNGQASFPASISIPTNVMNDSDENVSITVDEHQNFLYKVPVQADNIATAQTIQITFIAIDSNPVNIYQLFVLYEHLNIDDYNETEDLVGLTQYDDNVIPSGEIDSIPGQNSFKHDLNKPRDKRSFDFGIIAQAPSRFIDDFELFYNKYKNFTLGAEYTRFPNRVFLAAFSSQLSIRWINTYKGAGRIATVSVLER